jgi:hypothetical protein
MKKNGEKHALAPVTNSGTVNVSHVSRSGGEVPESRMNSGAVTADAVSPHEVRLLGGYFRFLDGRLAARSFLTTIQCAMRPAPRRKSCLLQIRIGEIARLDERQPVKIHRSISTK